MLIAGAILVKLVAVVPAAFLLLGDLLWSRPTRQIIRSWAVATAGGALILLPAAALLLSQPGFIDDVVRAQFDRPGLLLVGRLTFLVQDCIRYPLIPVALAASAWQMIRATDARVRVLSLVTLGSTITLVFAFKTFFGYYFVQVLPWVAVVFTLAFYPRIARVFSQWVSPVMLAATLFLGVGVPALYAEIYHHTAHSHDSSPAQIVPLLHGGDGYVYSMYPSFALQSGRELYPWYYTADSLIARATQRIGDADLTRVFSECQALVLWPDELADYPGSRAFVEQNFQIAYQDQSWTLWTRPIDATGTTAQVNR
jgi:hypothetical protein